MPLPPTACCVMTCCLEFFCVWNRLWMPVWARLKGFDDCWSTMSLAFLKPSAMVRFEAEDSSLKDRPGYRPVLTAKLDEVCIACCYRSLYWWLLADFGSVDS